MPVCVAGEGIPVDKIRVLLADDHPEMIATVRRTLGEEFEVIETAGNGQLALNAVLSLHPDIFVTDISMPILNGFQIASRIHKSNSRTRIIFLTIHEDRDFLAAALSAGAAGYVIKPRLSTDLVLAIHEVLKGNIFVSESMRV